MANCCEESKNKCNQIVDIGYLKDFVEGTDISVTTPQGKGDDYCPTYEELSSGRIAPITNDLGPELNGRDGILVNPTPYTASSTSSGCCPSSNRNKVVRAEDLSLSYYNLTNFDSSVSSTTSLCNAEGWLNIGYTIVKRKKSIDSNGCSAKTITDSGNFSLEADRETHGANICNNLGQEHPGGEVSCHTDPINYDMSYELDYQNRSETYIAEGSYAQEGMDLHIEWFNDLIDELIENEGFEEGIAIGSVSSSDNVTIGEPTATASFSPQSVGASVEDGEIILNVGEYINTDDRNITVTLPYTVCNTNYTASSSAFTQSGKPFVPTTKSPSCYSYTTSSITSCGSQLYLCKYNTGASNHMTNWAYIDGMRLKVDDNGYFNEQIAYSQHRHYINSGGTTAVDSNQERLGQHINAHAVYSADTNEANATFHVYTSRNATNNGMFEGVLDLVIVRLPCEVDTIGASSFTDCISLEEYRDIDQIEYIGNYAFENCSSLKVIGGGSSLKEIGDYAFHNCTTPTSVTLASSVSHVGRNAFENCTEVKQVTLPSGLRTINEETFKDCGNLETINLGNIRTIGESAFENCSSLDGVSFNNTNSVDIGEYAFLNCTSLGSVSLERGTIGDYAFEGCDALTSAEIGTYESNDSVDIGDYAFLNCTSLEWVSVKRGTIGDYAFKGCDELTGTTIDNYVTSIGNDIFNGCDSLIHLGYYSQLPFNDDLGTLQKLEELVIGDSTSVGTEEIGDNAFQTSQTLTSLTIGDSVETIGDNAFAFCTNLTSLNLNDGVKYIGEAAFYACRNLDSVTIPNSVRSIGDGAFSKCSLTSIDIPSSVTSIGTAPFATNNLSSINVDSNNSVYDSRNNCDAIIETATNELIQGCNNTVIPNTVTSIGYAAFEGCNSLTSIDIPSSVTGISTYAFVDCENLTSATVLATTPPDANYLIFGTTIRHIYVPASSVEAYKSSYGWDTYAEYIEPIT